MAPRAWLILVGLTACGSDTKWEWPETTPAEQQMDAVICRSGDQGLLQEVDGMLHIVLPEVCRTQIIKLVSDRLLPCEVLEAVNRPLKVPLD